MARWWSTNCVPRLPRSAVKSLIARCDDSVSCWTPSPSRRRHIIAARNERKGQVTARSSSSTCDWEEPTAIEERSWGRRTARARCILLLTEIIIMMSGSLRGHGPETTKKVVCGKQQFPPFRYPSRDAALEELCTFYGRASRKCGFLSHSARQA